MKLYRLSAITLKVKDMEKSCKFYSGLPGFKLTYGGAADSFTTFEVGEGSKVYLNLELVDDVNEIRPSKEINIRSNGTRDGRTAWTRRKEDFGRIIFHTEDVDALYQYMKDNERISRAVIFEGEPADAPWGERFFHIRDPDGYQLSFAQPLPKERKYYCE